jgi:hypothetical protein
MTPTSEVRHVPLAPAMLDGEAACKSVVRNGQEGSLEGRA